MSAPTGPAPTIPDAVADPPVGKNGTLVWFSHSSSPAPGRSTAPDGAEPSPTDAE